MPLYEYKCETCGAQFELIRKFSDPPLEACVACGSAAVEKLVSSPAFQFKGSGWYVTDYARKTGTDAKPGKESGAATSEKAGETPPSQKDPGSAEKSPAPATAAKDKDK